MKIQQENIRENSRIREIREHFLSWTIPVIRYIVVHPQNNTTVWHYLNGFILDFWPIPAAQIK